MRSLENQHLFVEQCLPVYLLSPYSDENCDAADANDAFVFTPFHSHLATQSLSYLLHMYEQHSCNRISLTSPDFVTLIKRKLKRKYYSMFLSLSLRIKWNFKIRIIKTAHHVLPFVICHFSCTLLKSKK